MIRIAILGSAHCGKTNLVHGLFDEDFVNEASNSFFGFKQRTNANYEIRVLTNEVVHRHNIPAYLGKASVILIAVDLSEEFNATKLQSDLDLCKTSCNFNPKKEEDQPKFILVGTKWDISLPDTLEQLDLFAESQGFPLCLSSVRTKEGLFALKHTIAKLDKGPLEKPSVWDLLLQTDVDALWLAIIRFKSALNSLPQNTKAETLAKIESALKPLAQPYSLTPENILVFETACQPFLVSSRSAIWARKVGKILALASVVVLGTLLKGLCILVAIPMSLLFFTSLLIKIDAIYQKIDNYCKQSREKITTFFKTPPFHETYKNLVQEFNNNLPPEYPDALELDVSHANCA